MIGNVHDGEGFDDRLPVVPSYSARAALLAALCCGYRHERPGVGAEERAAFPVVVSAGRAVDDVSRRRISLPESEKSVGSVAGRFRTLTTVSPNGLV